MKKFKVLKIIGIILVILVVIGLVTFAVDSSRAKDGKKPIFIFMTWHMKDGGSIEYYGLGYRITFIHQISCRYGEYYEGIHIGTWFSDNYKDITIIECTDEDNSFNNCLIWGESKIDGFACDMFKEELDAACLNDGNIHEYYCMYGMKNSEDIEIVE